MINQSEFTSLQNKEAQVKLQDWFALTTHPTLCEGRLPVTHSLHTTDWPKFQEREWPKHRQAMAKKFSGGAIAKLHPFRSHMTRQIKLVAAST